jgi:hypothetical protein
MLDSLDTLIAFVLIMLVVSLLITIVVQMISAALNLRGGNVAKGLRQSLNAVLPGFQTVGKEFVDHIVTGALLSDSSAKWLPKFWRRASAVRPDEVFDSIHRMAIGRKAASPEFCKNAQALLVALGFDRETLEDAARKVSGVVDTAKQAVAEVKDNAEAVIPDDAAKADLKALADRLNSLAATQLNRAIGGVVDAATSVDRAYKQFQYWYEIGQERAAQWFTIHTRICTVVFAIIFAFALQLDAVEIFKLVSTNRSVRDALVSQATAVTAQAAQIIGDGKTLLQVTLDEWRKAIPDPAIKEAVASVTAEAADTRGTIRQKIANAVDAAKLPNKEAVVGSFDSSADATLQEKLDKGAQQYGELKQSLDTTGFPLFVSGPLGRWGHGWCDDFWPHFWGMLYSAALLSLGAPFWYNSLKGLTSLRSTIAQNMSKEQKERQEHPSLGDTSEKPPTV